jgi:hypothetical protein
MNRTRKSPYYLAAYLLAGGLGLLIFPAETLKLLLSNGDYGNIFPRLVGMFASGFGLNVLGIIRARAGALYSATLMVRSYFLVCLAVFYWMSHDRMFLVIIGVVVLGMVLTLASYLRDRKEAA